MMTTLKLQGIWRNLKSEKLSDFGSINSASTEQVIPEVQGSIGTLENWTH